MIPTTAQVSTVLVESIDREVAEHPWVAEAATGLTLCR